MQEAVRTNWFCVGCGIRSSDHRLTSRTHVSDGQILEREQAHGAVQGVEPDRGADQDVVPEQAHQVEEAAGVQAEDRAPARLLPARAALRVPVRAALLLPGRGRRGSGRERRRRPRCRSKFRVRVAATAADHAVDGGTRGRRTRGTGTGRGRSGTTEINDNRDVKLY